MGTTATTGIAGAGVVIDNGAILSSALEVRDDFVTVDVPGEP